MPTVDVIDERVKEFLANNPQVVRAMEAWAKTSAQYEEDNWAIPSDAGRL